MRTFNYYIDIYEISLIALGFFCPSGNSHSLLRISPGYESQRCSLSSRGRTFVRTQYHVTAEKEQKKMTQNIWVSTPSFLSLQDILGPLYSAISPSNVIFMSLYSLTSRFNAH